MASLEIVQIAYVADRIDMQDEESRELAPLARDRGLSIRGNGVIRAQNVQINGGNLTSAGRDVHNHTHFHEAPQHDCEAAKADLISALESIDNFRQIQQDTLSKATPKTGEWIFEYEKFPIWRDPKSDIKTLWGSGIPGAGKTVLMSIVVNDVVRWAEEQDSTICVCYIYIRYSDNAKFTIRHCLEVLVKQTVEKHPSCLKLAENMYADHFRLHTRPTEEELFQLLKSFTTLIAVMFFFLDALDEAPPELQFSLVEKLSSLNVKLFITSRPLKTLQERFPNAHHFSITAQNSDLDLHINRILDTSRELWRILEQEGLALRAEIAASVKQNCGGMFLHASLQLASLQHSASVHDVKETLATFPPKIEDVYHHTWTRIVGQASSNGRLAQNCLIWVLNAPYSMTVAELEHATAVCLETHKFDPDRIVRIDTIVALCRGLLVVDEETDLVRLVHYTAKETLERLVLEGFPHLHSLMAALCIGHLIHHKFQDWKGGYGTFSPIMKANPLLRYAYHAWSRHALNSLHDTSMVTKVKEFVRGCRSFPLDRKGYAILELLGPLHVVAFFNLPIALASGHFVNTLNPNCRTHWKKYTPLHLACMHTSHINTLQELLSLRLIDVNAVNRWKQTPLFCAADSGNVGAVKLLLAHPKIRLDLADDFGKTAFMTAVDNRRDVVVKTMLAHSPGEIHSTDREGRTALSRACQQGHFAMVKLLLSHSQSEVHLADNDGRTPLSWAAGSRCLDAFTHILSLALDDVHLADKQGRTPLSWASSDGDEKAVKILLANPRTDVNQVDNAGCTPLSWASEPGQEGPVKALLANPLTNVNLADKEGRTPLSWASSGGSEKAVTILLANYRTDVNQVDNEGRTPLSHASEHGWEGVVTVLLANPLTNVNAADARGWTPLIWATKSEYGSVRLMRALLAHPQINVNLPDNEGLTPLIWAVESIYSTSKRLKALLAHPQIDVNLPDRKGRTPLVRFAMKTYYTSKPDFKGLRALLAHPQTDVNLADNKGRTALSLASKHVNPGIVKLLLEHPQIQVEPGRGLGELIESTVKGVRDLLSR